MKKQEYSGPERRKLTTIRKIVDRSQYGLGGIALKWMARQLGPEKLREFKIYNIKISELRMRPRTQDQLQSANIFTVGALIQHAPEDLLNIEGFGKASLQEVRRALDILGLKLEMDVSGKALLDSKVNVLNLSEIIVNKLKNRGISTVRELVQLSDSELLRQRNFGRTSLNRVKAKLAERDLHLGMELDE